MAERRLRISNSLAACALQFCLCLALPGCGNDSASPSTDSPTGSTHAASNLATNNGTPASSPQTSLSFTDVTAQSGVDWTYRNGEDKNHFAILESLGGGVGILDFDADGFADVILPGGGTFTGPDKQDVSGIRPGLFRNLSRLSFTDSTDLAFVGSSRFYTHAAAVCDFNNDGFSDFLLTGFGGLQLFENLGDGTFSPRPAAETGLTDSAWSSSAAFGDFNGDGHVDLYVSHYVDWSFANHPLCPGPEPGQREVCPPKDFSPLPDSLYISRGDGTFLDASSDWGLRPDGKGLGVVVGDIDLDGDLDVYVGNDTVPNFLYRNQGTHFADAGLMSGTSVSDRGLPDGSMGVDLGDFNLDGLPDLWVANYESEGFAMYRNEGDCFFQPVSSKLGINAISGLYVGWGTVFFDADLDGDLDIFVSNGHVIRYPTNAPLRQLPLVLENRNGERFVNVADQAGEYTSSPHMGRGLAVSDLDHDGDQDVILSRTNEPAAVLENNSHGKHHWIGFRLIGTHSARDAHGAIVRVRLKNSREIVVQVKSGSSYASSNDLTQIVGLGESTEVAHVSVRWPSGIESSLDKPARDVVHSLVENATSHGAPEVAQ